MGNSDRCDRLVKETFAEFSRHKSPWLAAAIAYFTIFAVAPLIISSWRSPASFWDATDAVLSELYGYLRATAGPSAASGIEAIVSTTFSQRKAGLPEQVIGWGVFAVAAVGLFSCLQEALNTVWDIEPVKRSLLETVKARILPFGAVLTVVFLLLVSLAIDTALT